MNNNSAQGPAGIAAPLEISGPYSDVRQFLENMHVDTLLDSPQCACIFQEPSLDVAMPDIDADGLNKADRSETIKQVEKINDAKTKTVGRIIQRLSQPSRARVMAHPNYKDAVVHSCDPFKLIAIVIETHKVSEVERQAKGIEAKQVLDGLKMIPGKYEAYWVKFQEALIDIARYAKPLGDEELATMFMGGLDKPTADILKARCHIADDFAKVMSSVELMHAHIRAGLSVNNLMDVAHGRANGQSVTDLALVAHRKGKSSREQCNIVNCPPCTVCTAIHGSGAKHCFHICRKIKQVIVDLKANGFATLKRKLKRDQHICLESDHSGSLNAHPPFISPPAPMLPPIRSLIRDSTFPSMAGTYVYVIRAGEKYYVGTTRDVNQRVQEHRSGNGSAWTKSWPTASRLKLVLEESKIYNTEAEARDEETRKTATLCYLHGLDNVRGAQFCLVNPTLSDKDKWCITIGHVLKMKYEKVKNHLLGDPSQASPAVMSQETPSPMQAQASLPSRKRINYG